MTDTVDIDLARVIHDAQVTGFQTAIDILEYEDQGRKRTNHLKSRQRLKRELMVVSLKTGIEIPEKDVLSTPIETSGKKRPNWLPTMGELFAALLAVVAMYAMAAVAYAI